MEASRPPLKRNRSKGNIQINKKYQHLNWPNALTKNENDSDVPQSSSTGIFFTVKNLRKFFKNFLCIKLIRLKRERIRNPGPKTGSGPSTRTNSVRPRNIGASGEYKSDKLGSFNNYQAKSKCKSLCCGAQTNQQSSE